ncbi:winged helix-turn-helix transcriptional regulator [Planotetraspora sp. A-T 1434]|uniref:winged helix-turn-helix transcriptional regulator n=1 Tax=Planotetraspora sp. A-T 1434 TaxID=2979219 RepID=UPI0021C161A0|nr:winged helix-turn-helix transcriptional regulator [Planotetraspora sp. A-T 1434]MCT9931886.1 winged helix-turn-helix transcriptional regulator [Planotetraspora sp. A-T 1434]
MRARTYGQHCAIAKALDVVGERWALLIVRELLDGPRRYTDLLGGLPGVSTDMLATRLRDLENAGLVSRRTLPPPAASKVYELTAEGRALAPAMTELARFGMRLLRAQDPSDTFRVHWLALPLQIRFRADRARGVALTVQFHTDDGALCAVIDDGILMTRPGAADHPDVVITADAATLAEIARDPATTAEAKTAGRLTVVGDPDKVAHVRRILSLDS